VSVARDEERLETILKLMADIGRRLAGLTFDAFSADADEIDLTAYRLAAIGESAGRLSDDVKARHPDVPWKAIRSFRNVVSHDYAIVLPEFVWAATQELDPIRQMCLAELTRIRSLRP
jgi:uncharacterized protein with HEPN domain